MSTYRMTVYKVMVLTTNMAMLGNEVLLPVSLIAKWPEESVTISVPFDLCRRIMWSCNLLQVWDVKGQDLRPGAKTR